jgi:hypothetical protein
VSIGVTLVVSVGVGVASAVARNMTDCHLAHSGDIGPGRRWRGRRVRRVLGDDIIKG